jgi:hypothetical protein
MLVLVIFQQRWVAFYAQSSVIVLAFLIPVAVRLIRGRLRAPVLAAGAVILAGAAAFLFVQQGQRLEGLREGRAIDKQIAKTILIKRFAVQMAHHLGPAGGRVMGEPGLAPAFFYFGGIPSVASFYWENREGVRDAAEFFDATDAAVSRRIAEGRGITHIVLPLGGGSAKFFHAVHEGDGRVSDPASLASRLERGDALPAWLSRDHSFDGMDRSVFGSWQLKHALGVWRVTR